MISRAPAVNTRYRGRGAHDGRLRDADSDKLLTIVPVELSAALVKRPNAMRTRILPGQWNTFEATLNGDTSSCFYNGAKVGEPAIPAETARLVCSRRTRRPAGSLWVRNLRVSD